MFESVVCEMETILSRPQCVDNTNVTLQRNITYRYRQADTKGIVMKC